MKNFFFKFWAISVKPFLILKFIRYKRVSITESLSIVIPTRPIIYTNNSLRIVVPKEIIYHYIHIQYFYHQCSTQRAKCYFMTKMFQK